jgi:putative ABC transport system substrate-binding protein
MAAKRVDAFTLIEDALVNACAKTLAELAARRRPSSIGFPEYADAGGLIGFGVSVPDMFRRAASYVDKILGVVKPGWSDQLLFSPASARHPRRWFDP